MPNYYITAGDRDGYFIYLPATARCNQFTNFLTWWQFGYEPPDIPFSPETINTGFLFYAVNIPNRSRIISANLLMHINVSPGFNYAPYTIQYRAIKEANTQVPISCADANSKTRTSNFVSEYISSMPDGIWHTSPNLSSIVQEVVDLPNWNNNLMFYVNMAQTEYNYEYIDSYENSPSLATILSLEFLIKGKVAGSDNESPANLSATSEEVVKDIDIGDRPIRP